MATDFILAPNARWQGRDQTGQPIENGKLYTYLNQTVSPKATYQDYEGLQPNTNPVILDGKGEANIYWAVDDLYTIKLFTSDDQEVYTQDNYPVVGTNTTRIISESEANISRNNQFTYWYYGSDFSPVAGVGSQNNSDFICDDWLYKRVSTTYTVNITRQTFAIDQDEVPGNPKYFFRYQATTAPTGETNNRLYQRYEGVQTLAGQVVTVGLYAKSPTASTINVYLVQDFGTGGSPSTEVATLVGQFDLTTSWAIQSGTITLPTLAGKTLGSNNDDALILRINFPNDVVATVDLCDTQFQVGANLSANFPFQTEEVQFQELVNRIQNGVASTGDVKPTIKATADDGWIMCNDQTIGNVGSGATNTGFSMKALYTLIWNQVANKYAPIYDSAGAITTRGASAEVDFNALKRLALTKTLGRVIASSGEFHVASTFTADAGTDLLTLPNALTSFYNAVPVELTTTGTLPAPLAPATTYYVVYVGATTIRLATSIANAINNSYINITDAGTGTHTITIDYTNYEMGQFVGEQTHGLILAETPSHFHSPTSGGNFLTSAAAGVWGGGANGSEQSTTNAQGGSGVHNIIQPTIYLRHMMKL